MSKTKVVLMAGAYNRVLRVFRQAWEAGKRAGMWISLQSARAAAAAAEAARGSLRNEVSSRGDAEVAAAGGSEQRGGNAESDAEEDRVRKWEVLAMFAAAADVSDWNALNFVLCVLRST